MPVGRTGCREGAAHCYCSIQLMVLNGKPKGALIDQEYDSIAKWCVGKSHSDKKCGECVKGPDGKWDPTNCPKHIPGERDPTPEERGLPGQVVAWGNHAGRKIKTRCRSYKEETIVKESLANPENVAQLFAKACKNPKMQKHYPGDGCPDGEGGADESELELNNVADEGEHEGFDDAEHDEEKGEHAGFHVNTNSVPTKQNAASFLDLSSVVTGVKSATRPGLVSTHEVYFFSGAFFVVMMFAAMHGVRVMFSRMQMKDSAPMKKTGQRKSANNKKGGKKNRVFSPVVSPIGPTSHLQDGSGDDSHSSESDGN